MRVLVTGSAGQLGAAIVRLLTPEHDVIGLDLIPGLTTTQVGDLADRPLLDRLLVGVEVVIHTAALHARHLRRASKAQFIATNVGGTEALLHAAAAHRVARVVYTSSTSVYGDALVPSGRAVWVTEELPPQPRDIYDVTKLAAEGLCRLFWRETGAATICLRVGRFFPEPPEQTALYRLYRGLDPRDAAEAHRLAATAPTSGFGVYNIAARSPFTEADCGLLRLDAAAVIRRHHPEAEPFFVRQGWSLPRQIDRVYVIDRAIRDLGYAPRHTFAAFLREWAQRTA